MAFDYLENIVNTILILLYPTEIVVLPILGVTMSLLKWVCVVISVVSNLGISIILLVNYIADSTFETNSLIDLEVETYELQKYNSG